MCSHSTAARGFFQGTQERVRNSRAKRAISGRAIEGLLYIIECFLLKQGWSGGYVNFLCRGVLPIWIIAGQGPIALAVGAGGIVWTFFLLSVCSLFFPSFLGTVRYRLKYCLKRLFNLKQPTNQFLFISVFHDLKMSVYACMYSMDTSHFQNTSRVGMGGGLIQPMNELQVSCSDNSMCPCLVRDPRRMILLAAVI